MKVASDKQSGTTVASRIAGEDIRRGDYVTALNEVVELPSFLWDCSSISIAPEEPIRFRYMPHDAGKPLKVLRVCLPFVYAKDRLGNVVTIDTRRRQLVLLDRSCAKQVWKELGTKKRRKKRK